MFQVSIDADKALRLAIDIWSTEKDNEIAWMAVRPLYFSAQDPKVTHQYSGNTYLNLTTWLDLNYLVYNHHLRPTVLYFGELYQEKAT